MIPFFKAAQKGIKAVTNTVKKIRDERDDRKATDAIKQYEARKVQEQQATGVVQSPAQAATAMKLSPILLIVIAAFFLLKKR